MYIYITTGYILDGLIVNVYLYSYGVSMFESLSGHTWWGVVHTMKYVKICDRSNAFSRLLKPLNLPLLYDWHIVESGTNNQ